MKITPDDFRDMLAAVAPHDTPARRAVYVSGDFPRADRVKDLDVRYRWDLLWHAVRTDDTCRETLNRIYQYAGDRHVDTALRKIVPALPRPRCARCAR